MVEFIKDIISRFGGRYFGSEQEKKAQEYTKTILDKYCNKTELMAFDSALEAHFQSLKLFCVLYVVSLVLYKINVPLACLVSVVTTFFFMGHFVTYRHWLDFLFKNKTSYNVIGDVEPINEPITTIIISGHIDSVKEFKWWYKLKHTGAVLSIIAGFLFPLLSVFMLISLAVDANIMQYVWLFFVITSPVLIVYFDMHGTRVVDGALDNLTGVAMAVEMAKYFSENKLKNTRVRCISFGAEEAGLRGAWAYSKKNKTQLVGFNKEHIKQLEMSFKATNVVYKKLPLDIGASDASAFRMQGLPALSLIGMMSDKLDPCYHTRLDNIEHLDGAAMEAMKKVLIHFIENWDQENSAGGN
jgi:hypothetical protein